MSQIKLVIFDFDGTLADSFAWFSQAIVIAAEKYNFKRPTAHELEKLRGQNSREIIAELGISWWKIFFIARFMRGLMNQNIKSIKTFKGIDKVLWELRNQGVVLAIVTSNSKENVESILGAELAALFDHYECKVSLFRKREGFKKILSRYGLSAHQVLSIGDEVRDIEAAKALGIQSGAVTWGYANLQALKASGPNYIFESIEDLTSVI